MELRISAFGPSAVVRGRDATVLGAGFDGLLMGKAVAGDGFGGRAVNSRQVRQFAFVTSDSDGLSLNSNDWSYLRVGYFEKSIGDSGRLLDKLVDCDGRSDGLWYWWWLK